MLLDLHAHRFWDDPKLEQEETVNAGHEEMLAAMERRNAELMAEQAAAKPKEAPTTDQMRERAVERARRLRERLAGVKTEAPPAAAPGPAARPGAGPAQPVRALPAPPAKRGPIPPAGNDDEWEDVVNEDYSGS